MGVVTVLIGECINPVSPISVSKQGPGPTAMVLLSAFPSISVAAEKPTASVRVRLMLSTKAGELLHMAPVIEIYKTKPYRFCKRNGNG